MTSVAGREPIGPDVPSRMARGALTRRRGAITRHVLDTAGLLRKERVTLGEVFDRLGPDGFGLALLLLTLPTLIPVPGPLGMTFGTLIALVALQVMVGARALWLPSVLHRRPLPNAALRRVIARALPWLSWAEGWLKEGRLAPLAGGRMRVLLAIPLLLLGVALTLPIPFGNVAPALALVAFAVGFMGRDGAVTLVALILSIAALAWTGFLLAAGAALLDWALAHVNL